MSKIEVDQAHRLRTQDLRRGHSKDMKDHGSTMRDILAAGEWRYGQISFVSLDIGWPCAFRSQGVFSYLDRDEVEADAALEAHWESSSDDESDISL